MKKNRSFLVIAFSALILTILVGYTAIRLEKIYRENYPYRSVDPVYYSYYNAKLSIRLSNEDRLSLVADEWSENNRFPLRTVPLLLFAPAWLAKPYGHMATSLPMFFINNGRIQRIFNALPIPADRGYILTGRDTGIMREQKSNADQP